MEMLYAMNIDYYKDTLSKKQLFEIQKKIKLS